MSAGYVTKEVEKPPGWDPLDSAGMEQVRRFNMAMEPGMRITVDKDSVRAEMRSVRMDRLAEAAAALERGGLGEAVVRCVQSVRSYGYSNGTRLFAGYGAERKVRGRAEKSRARLSGAAPREAAAGAALPAKYLDRMFCADSEQFLKGLPDGCIDLVFTSPPYNFGLDYENGGNDADRWQAYFAKLFAVLDECARVLRHGGRLIVNVQPLFSDYIPTHHVISGHLSKSLLWKGEILWEKNNYNCKYTAWGSWKSPSSPYLKYTWEFLEVFCKGSIKKEGSREDADIDADDFKKWVYAKWSVGPERRMKEHGHPAMFPEELARRAIQLFSFRGDVVLDPFMGVGTACKAARDLGRGYLGIDISEGYVEKARRRLAA